MDISERVYVDYGTKSNFGFCDTVAHIGGLSANEPVQIRIFNDVRVRNYESLYTNVGELLDDVRATTTQSNDSHLDSRKGILALGTKKALTGKISLHANASISLSGVPTISTRAICSNFACFPIKTQTDKTSALTMIAP